jgi:hypothetical protein
VPARPAKQSKGSTLSDRLRKAARAGFVGRERDLAWLERALLEEAVAAVFVHGIGGIGKSALLEAAALRLTARRCCVLQLDGHEVEPTPEGLLAAFAQRLGTADQRLPAIARAFAARPEPAVVIAIDDYDGLRLLDAWIRRELMPAMPACVRVIFAGRSRPVAAWAATPGWDQLFRSLSLSPLSPQDAALLLEQHDLTPEQRIHIGKVAGGHPLALRLGAAAAQSRPDLPLGEIESRFVVSELVRRFLADVRDARERAAVEAASVLRRVTRPLLVAMLGAEEAEWALQALQRMPFVESAADGLVVHQSVRNAVEDTLRATDPNRHRQLRSRAWQQLNHEVQQAQRDRRWQLTADVLYLLDHAVIREAVFPSDVVRYGVEPALSSDRDAILAIASRHLDACEAGVLQAWWDALPEAFVVARGERQELLAFYAIAFEQSVPQRLLPLDPLLRCWKGHRERNLPNNARPVLFCRALLSARLGSEPCEELACCVIDIKRLYMRHLDLAAIYVIGDAGAETTPYAPLGFVLPRELRYTTATGARVSSAVLEFGPGVLPWLNRVIDAQWDEPASEPTAAPESAVRLDRATRELLVDGQHKPLTRLEYGVFDCLDRRRGSVVSRDELLAAAWGQEHTGSNVVDAVIRTLRKKLGAHASAILTVTGFGYKLVA